MDGLPEESLAPVRLSLIRSWRLGTNQWGAIVQGMVLGPLSLGPRPHCTVRDPIPVGPLVLLLTHFRAQAEPECREESVLSGKHQPINYNLIGSVLARCRLRSRQPSIALGNITAE